jgi:hypothetical protein
VGTLRSELGQTLAPGAAPFGFNGAAVDFVFLFVFYPRKPFTALITVQPSFSTIHFFLFHAHSFAFFCTFLQATETQLFRFHSLPHSASKNEGRNSSSFFSANSVHSAISVLIPILALNFQLSTFNPFSKPFHLPPPAGVLEFEWKRYDT